MPQSFATFDLETASTNDAVVAVGFYDGEHYVQFLKEDENDDVVWRFIKAVAKLGIGELYALEARYYANKFILECLMRHDQRIKTNSGLFSIKWVEGNLQFKDTCSLMKMTIKEACTSFNVPYEGSIEGGLTMRQGNLRRDTVCLSKVYTEFIKRLFISLALTEEEGPGQTLSLTALRLFKKFHSMKEIDPNEKYFYEMRQALYATRNEVYQHYGEKLDYYDIRSMYTSCYSINVPTGKLIWRAPSIDKGTFAMARIKVSETSFIGPLPVYCNGKLIFPVGEFEGWWDMTELRYAKELGCKVTLIKQLDAQETPILQEYGQFMTELRDSESSPLAGTWKQLAILLSGKFAQSRPMTDIRHAFDITDMNDWEPLTVDGPYFSGIRKHQRNINARPGITVRIRAAARVKHHRMLMSVLEQGGDIHYCDTDSIFCSQGLDMPIGPAPGDLRFEGSAQRAYFIMQKFYGVVDHKGTLWQKSAGFRDVRMKEPDWIKLLDNDEVLIDTGTKDLSTPREIISSGSLQYNGGVRTVRRPSDGQNRLPDGKKTKPYVLDIKKERNAGGVVYKGGL